MDSRADYRAEQKALARYKLEEQAARRLRIPDPEVSAGVKRADVTSGMAPNPFSNVTRTGVVFSLSVPLPVFNNGRYEVARYQAEQTQATARAAVLARQIQAEIQGAREVLMIRRDALAAYQRELESAGVELTRITRVAYEEGEVGILAGVPRTLPALVRAQQVDEKVARASGKRREPREVIAQVRHHQTALEAAVATGDRASTERALGTLLFGVVRLAHQLDLSAEIALRSVTEDFIDRVERLEGDARTRGATLAELPPAELASLQVAPGPTRAG